MPSCWRSRRSATCSATQRVRLPGRGRPGLGVIAEWRNRIDTTFSEITVPMELARHGADTFWGLLTRTAAHTLLRLFLSHE
jgi:hypothetical protein